MTTPIVQLVAIQMPDGSVPIMHFILNDFKGVRCEGTDEEIEREVRKITGTAAISWKRIDVKDIPFDRSFRNAWRFDGKEFSVHMPTAREIHRERMRRARAPKLAELDVQLMKAIEFGEDLGPIRVKKQVLRDVTKHEGIEKAQTPEELKLVWPKELK